MEPNDEQQRIRTRVEWNLYTSHFLSMWNSRLFEFGAVLFLASIFPSTLSPMSIYALVRSASAIVLANPIGQWIDRGHRLVVVRVSILGQRFAVAASCGVLYLLERRIHAPGLFPVLVALACVEKLCATMNTIAVERDWVVVITEGDEDWRRGVNARIRRIDLACKLVGPLAISIVAVASIVIAIWTVLGMTLASVLVEYICITKTYASVPALDRTTVDDEEQGNFSPPTSPSEPVPSVSISTPSGEAVPSVSSTPSGEPVPSVSSSTPPSEYVPSASPSTPSWLTSAFANILPIRSMAFYVRHPAFLPSFSLALLYLTVLSFSGQMMTYLIAVGYTSLHVGIARTGSTIVELSATWIAPRLMHKIGPIRGGLWSLSWQMTFLAVGVSCFMIGQQQNHWLDPSLSATILAVCVAMSRLGLWGFDLCAQVIVQDEVEATHRGSFSTAEAAFQNLFELLSYGSTILFSRPDEFQWPMLMSTAAVYMSGLLYAVFLRSRRGHLFHAPPCLKGRTEGRIILE